MKKVPLLGGASPYRPLYGVPLPPGTRWQVNGFFRMSCPIGLACITLEITAVVNTVNVEAETKQLVRHSPDKFCFYHLSIDWSFSAS